MTNPADKRSAPLDLDAIKARVLEYIRLVGMGYTERFEVQAERFYCETGLIAPGKSVPLEMRQDESERAREWAAFQLRDREQYQQDLTALLEEVARLRAEIGRGAAHPPQAWQPIETAPKDGTRLLLARTQVLSGELIVVSGSWNSGGSMHMPHWMTPVLGFQPTHWMPLPAPPEGERT
jgi:hypothetical protein